jgi:flavin reductase (DIM6/NTAB) family NADH-FMN oxidoreductase RutF/rubredoxin
MIDQNALFKITYGLYIVCTGDKKRGNGFISNTVFQVTAVPPKFVICCSKNNYSAELIEKFKVLSVTILAEDTPTEIFSTFGYKSGRDTDKLKKMKVIYGKTGVPIVLNSGIAYLEMTVIDKVDVGTHWMFICNLEHAESLDANKEPITYDYYHKVKKGLAPKNAPTYIGEKIEKQYGSNSNNMAGYKKYICLNCNYIYDEAKEGIRFEDLPDEWECPVCGSPKSDFEELV